MASYINPDSGNLVITGESGLDFNDRSTTKTITALGILGDQWIEGNLYINGSLLVESDVITLGSGSGSLTFNSNISSNVIPSTTNEYEIGNNAQQWKNVFTQQLTLSSSPLSGESNHLSVTNSVSHITQTSSSSLTLGDGIVGQVKVVIATEDVSSSPVTVTPANGLGFTNIVFDSEGESVTLMYTTNGWSVLNNFKATVT